MRYLAVFSCASVMAFAGCTGSIMPESGSDGDEGVGSDEGGSGGGARPGGKGGSSGSGGAGGYDVGGSGGGVVPDGCTAAESTIIPRARLWRLSSAQYANTVKQVFGVNADTSGFPLDGVSDDQVTRFDTSSEKNLVTDQLASLYEQQATKVATSFVASLVSQNACVVSASPTSCAPAFWKDLAGKAYRRPLTTAEGDKLAGFFEAARKTYDVKIAARMTTEAILQSPSFLYRFELGAANTGAKVPLSQHEVAAQLSYYLADVPPDDALRAAADKGELKSAAALAPHAERLLALPTAKAKLQSFFRIYLGLKGLVDGKTKDAEAFPMFTDALKTALVNDANAAIGKVAFEGTGTFDGMFADEVTLASGLSNVYGTQKRTGLITHPAVIAALSNESTTSPVHRGLFYYQAMLCRALPPPPADASSQTQALRDPANPNGTEREQWAYFQKTSPGCASCHLTFQPLGLALENYDTIGRHRTEENGKRIDPSVDVADLDPELDGAYEDGVALAQAIAGSDVGRACFALQVTTFAFGRSVDADAESCRLRSLAKRWSGKPLELRGFLTAMAQDESFFYRSYE